LQWTAADVRFDRETHTSTLPDGSSVPHVTAILEAVGLKTDFTRIASFNQRTSDAVELSTHRGEAVHADCHALDDGELAWDLVDPRILPYVNAWERCKADLNLSPILHARERFLFHPVHQFCGIMDGLFRRADAKTILGDLKTGDPEAAAAHVQTAAYELALSATHPELIVDERWSIWLTPRLTVPYRILNYSARPDAWLDRGKFLACLTVYREQAGRRRKVTA
jgi:hypothetical protein